MRKTLFVVLAALAALFLSASSAQAQEQNASVVYFTRDISPEGLVKIYEALGLPKDVKPYCIVPIGHPSGNDKPKDKWKPENIHYEKW